MMAPRSTGSPPSAPSPVGKPSGTSPAAERGRRRPSGRVGRVGRGRLQLRGVALRVAAIVRLCLASDSVASSAGAYQSSAGAASPTRSATASATSFGGSRRSVGPGVERPRRRPRPRARPPRPLGRQRDVERAHVGPRGEGRGLRHLLGHRGQPGGVVLAFEALTVGGHGRLEPDDLGTDLVDAAVDRGGVPGELVLEGRLAGGDGCVGLVLDPGDLGLGPLADRGDVVLGLLLSAAAPSVEEPPIASTTCANRWDLVQRLGLGGLRGRRDPRPTGRPSAGTTSRADRRAGATAVPCRPLGSAPQCRWGSGTPRRAAVLRPGETEGGVEICLGPGGIGRGGFHRLRVVRPRPRRRPRGQAPGSGPSSTEAGSPSGCR